MPDSDTPKQPSSTAAKASQTPADTAAQSQNASEKSTKSKKQTESAKYQQQIAQLEAELEQARSAQARALADYQNLVRRSQQERSQWVQYATTEFVQQLLQPLEHLSMAAQQLDDSGLNMVVTQLWQTLEQNGLKEIEALGKPFDVETMEVVENQPADSADLEQSENLVVTKVHRRGYILGDKVIQHAKVVLGTNSH